MHTYKNTCLQHRGGEEAVKRDTPISKKYIKTCPFYLDQGLSKGGRGTDVCIYLSLYLPMYI